MPTTSYHSPVRVPFITKARVREVSGYDTQRDVADAQLDGLILSTQAEFIHDLARLVHAPLRGSVNGSNTVFTLPAEWSLIFDDTGNAVVDGSDLYVYSEDRNTTPATRTTLTVSAADSRHGTLTLASAPAAGLRVYLEGFLINRVLDLELAKHAHSLLVAHYADQRVLQSQGQSLANPQAGRTFTHGRNRNFYQQYRRIMGKLRPPMRGAYAPRARIHDHYHPYGYPEVWLE